MVSIRRTSTTYSTIGFSFHFRTLLAMNCRAAITNQMIEAANSNGTNKNEAQNISNPAYSHQGQACCSWLKPWHTPCQPVAVETNPAAGMARHSKRLATRKISLMMRKARFTGASLPENLVETDFIVLAIRDGLNIKILDKVKYFDMIGVWNMTRI